MGGVIDRAKAGGAGNYGKEYTRKSGVPETPEQAPEEEQETQGQGTIGSSYYRSGNVMNETIDLKRWNKLAGLSKK